MITRCPGISTGLGYLVGGGYKGKTKELDNAVLNIANLLQTTYERDIVVRFNSDRESGGAFIKDNETDAKLGIGAVLSSSIFNQMTKEEHIALTYKEQMNLPRDCLSFDAILDKSLLLESCEYDLYQRFDTADSALDWISKNADATALKAYLDELPIIEQGA